MTYKFSPSSLSLLKECPRCFWLRFNKNIKRPDTIFPSLPSGMDKILKEHFDRFIEKGELPPELQELNGEVTLFDDKELLQVWRNNFKGIQWTDDKGNVFMGAVDNILKIEDKLIVLDYKTRGYALKEDTHKYYQDQMDIYNFLLRNNGYQTEDYTYLLFYHPNKIDENGSVDFHADLIKIKINVKNAENIFKRAVDVLEGEMPEPSDECGFCKWIYECNCEMK
ncbi:MAG: PD-(D/E)XK nuclease family protein [Methanocellales archaeon]|nr:PD-(D/E)XK nuclease family protein [Methanocellales archaeon]MDD5447141.1 PD-(D/E)XK nuclease family protein [Methanocellales archaeon]